MTEKAVISEYTYRSLASQRSALAGMPIFVLPEDLPQLFRATTRKTSDTLHVVSLAVLAPNEKAFREFLSDAKKKGATINSIEEGQISINGNLESIVREWRFARVNGAARVGGRASAEKKKAATKAAAEKVRHLWCLPSRQYSIKAIEKLSGISRGSLRSVLGNRGPAQYNYQAAQKRKERRNAKI